MFNDIRLSMLYPYLTTMNNPIPKDLNMCYYIFVRKQKIKFAALSHTVKYNVFYSFENKITIYVPCAICNAIDTIDNSTLNTKTILSNKIFVKDSDGIYLKGTAWESFENKYFIIIDYENPEIAHIAKNMYDNLKKREEKILAEQKEKITNTEIKHKNMLDEFDSISDDFYKELEQVLEKYHVRIMSNYGEDIIEYNGEELIERRFII